MAPDWAGQPDVVAKHRKPMKLQHFIVNVGLRSPQPAPRSDTESDTRYKPFMGVSVPLMACWTDGLMDGATGYR